MQAKNLKLVNDVISRCGDAELLKITVKDEVISFTATSSSISGNISFRIPGEADAKIVVKMLDFKTFCYRALQEKIVEFEINRDVIKAKAGDTKIWIKGVETPFAEIVEPDYCASVKICSPELADVLSDIDPSDNVQIIFKDGILDVVSSDGKCISSRQCDYEGNFNGMVYVVGKFLSSIRPLLSDNNKDFVKISISEDHLKLNILPGVCVLIQRSDGGMNLSTAISSVLREGSIRYQFEMDTDTFLSKIGYYAYIEGVYGKNVYSKMTIEQDEIVLSNLAEFSPDDHLYTEVDGGGETFWYASGLVKKVLKNYPDDELQMIITKDGHFVFKTDRTTHIVLGRKGPEA